MENIAGLRVFDFKFYSIGFTLSFLGRANRPIQAPWKQRKMHISRHFNHGPLPVRRHLWDPAAGSIHETRGKLRESIEGRARGEGGETQLTDAGRRFFFFLFYFMSALVPRWLGIVQAATCSITRQRSNHVWGDRGSVVRWENEMREFVILLRRLKSEPPTKERVNRLPHVCGVSFEDFSKWCAHNLLRNVPEVSSRSAQEATSLTSPYVHRLIGDSNCQISTELHAATASVLSWEKD
jgi:hypothetical protein